MTTTINKADTHTHTETVCGCRTVAVSRQEKGPTNGRIDRITQRKACRGHAENTHTNTQSHDGVPRISDKSLHTEYSPALSAAEYD